MSCAGHRVVETPTLDKLAKQGTPSPTATPFRPSVAPRGPASSVAAMPTSTASKERYPAHNGKSSSPPSFATTATTPPYRANSTTRPSSSTMASTSSGASPTKAQRRKWLHGVSQEELRLAREVAQVPGTCPWPDDPLGKDVGIFKYPPRISRPSGSRTARSIISAPARTTSSPGSCSPAISSRIRPRWSRSHGSANTTRRHARPGAAAQRKRDSR